MTLLVENSDLREAYRRGERDALAKVYDDYARSVFSFLIKGFSFNTGDGRFFFKGYKESWLLENAVQEVFVRAFKERARLAYDGVRPFKNYLFTIARNLVIDDKRKCAREFIGLDDLPEGRREGSAVGGGREVDPERAAQEKQLEREVGRFVSELGGDELSLFEVRFRGGLSIEATAKKLGVTEHWVKKHEKRIKKRFFYYMRERGYFEGFGRGTARGGIALLLLMLAANGA